MQFKDFVNFPAGREYLKSYVKEVSAKKDKNVHPTHMPKSFAKEMVRGISNLKSQSKILVLFNVELVEALIEEGFPVEKITFGTNCELEKAMVKGMFKVKHTVLLGRTTEEIKILLDNNVGKYDVILNFYK